MSLPGTSEISERLAELESLGLARRLRMVSGPQGPRVLLDGSPVLLLCSNNYLGLADHPRVREAAAEAAMRWGVGAGASRLVSGTMTIHRRLEESLAAFKGSEACVLFGSGYLANLGVIGALAGREGVVFSDELNHASIIDGCRLSGARIVVYRHADVEHLDWSLHRHGERAAERLIVTDSVFSMDGDVAPLVEIAELAERHGARVVVDEAHATGNLGPGGRGAVAEAGLEGKIDVVVGTLGKALGSYGAYACASAEMVRYLINAARSLIFSTAPGPPAVAGALAALQLLADRPHRVQRLRTNARTLRRALADQGFPVADSAMHIVPLVVGDEREAMALCQGAIERGVFAQAIRPPTVPPGTARLRLTTMASHAPGELVGAAGVLGAVARELDLSPASMRPAVEDRAQDLYQAELESGDGFELDQEQLGGALPEGRLLTPFDFDANERAAAEEPVGDPRLDAPFDFEAHEGAAAEEPVGDRSLDVSFEFDASERTAAGRAERSRSLDAPFDFEREMSGARRAA